MSKKQSDVEMSVSFLASLLKEKLLIFWNKIDQVAEYSQQIIDMQREIEQQAIRRREERIRMHIHHTCLPD